MSGSPLAVRAPPTAQALLPLETGPSWESSAASSPSTARARRSQISLPRLAKSRCWAWNVASGIHSGQGCGSMPRVFSSGASACSPALTPSTYAATKAVVSSSRAVVGPPGGVGQH